ncbi:RNA polymerase II transcriptional coactivator activated rna polymerase II transcriptional [Fasciolopsis buskii]|uniref:RNA polymerase II transcriptional coactivator activated rna polymerase II transcriptional n=1 Tax=Fasciolopsis buskii TaxID=27845 RepID=A0A8E0RKV0_9TREM|nr:RNA polymerase II transcriptional coactivator activated rna polymerase II transcriptional [Fasciolopsis buski]
MSAKKHRKSHASSSEDDSLSDLDSPPPSKKKVSEGNKSSSSTEAKVQYTTNSDGDKMLDLTGKKYVCVRQFKGRVFVDIREYYEDKSSGDLKPGKKGISLNVEQWDFLKGMMNDIDKDIVNVHR